MRKKEQLCLVRHQNRFPLFWFSFDSVSRMTNSHVNGQLVSGIGGSAGNYKQDEAGQVGNGGKGKKAM